MPERRPDYATAIYIGAMVLCVVLLVAAAVAVATAPRFTTCTEAR